MRISFIGGGVMAEAIVGGILDAGLAQPENIAVGELLETRRATLEKQYGLRCYAGNREAADGADIVVLAIKPQDLPRVLADLRGQVQSRQAVASIVAGARLADLATGLDHPAVIRVMPNTPAQIRQGMTVWTAAPEVADEQKAAMGDILRTLGDELYVDDEKLIDMATALSASGPAYVFLFIESLIDAGVYLGMPRQTARRLVVQTVLGSTKLVADSGKHPAELRDLVTSPGGTTAEALFAFERGGFRSNILEAVVAAYKKSAALANAQ